MTNVQTAKTNTQILAKTEACKCAGCSCQPCACGKAQESCAPSCGCQKK